MGLVARLEQVINSTASMFAEMGDMKMEPVRFKLQDGVTPTCVPVARRIPFPLMDKVKQQIERMVKMGVVQEVKESTEWCSPIILVLKMVP